MVDHLRSIRLTSAPTLPRTSILTSEHQHVDFSLKELRNLSRRLAAIALPYSQELQVLERIYYKGKNQHRSSLFWKKVVEIRRLAARINELNLHGTLESLRSSFHTLESHSNTNSKPLRSPWTHAPDLSACKTTLKRFQSACFLIDRARVRFRVAYQSFIVQLRMATFLPLIVSLIAITSRLDFLAAEVRSILPSQWEAVMRVVKAIDPTSKLKDDRSIQLPSFPITLRLSGEEASSNRLRKVSKLSGGTVEDLGSKVDREIESHFAIPAPEKKNSTVVSVHGYPTSNPSTVQPVDQIMHALLVEPSNLSFTPKAPDVSNYPVIPLSSDTSAPLVPPIFADNISSGKDEAQRKRKSFADVNPKKRVKPKVKKKRDEIDDIFGS